MSVLEAVVSTLIETEGREERTERGREGGAGWEGYGYAGIFMEPRMGSTYPQLNTPSVSPWKSHPWELLSWALSAFPSVLLYLLLL